MIQLSHLKHIIIYFILLLSCIVILPQADLEMMLKEKEEELQFLKQHAERERQQAEREKQHVERVKEEAEREKEQAEREKKELQTHLLEMSAKKDQEHKKQLLLVKREVERQKQNTLAMQDVCMLK